MTTETEKSPREIAENIARLSLPFSAFRNESEWKDVIAFLTNVVEKALRDRDERAAIILESRANELQSEWDRPPCAENGFMAMTADTPAGYATWWGMGQLRKLASAIRGKSNG